MIKRIATHYGEGQESNDFKNGFPARMSSTTDFVSPNCLCMLAGIAYKKGME